jgi:hypothetical protein
MVWRLLAVSLGITEQAPLSLWEKGIFGSIKTSE